MLDSKKLLQLLMLLILVCCLGGIIAHSVLDAVRGPDGWKLTNQFVPLWFCIIAAFSAVQALLELQPAPIKTMEKVIIMSVA